MSFFKKLKDEFKELMGDDKDKKKDQPTSQQTQGHAPEGQKDFSHNQPPQQQQHYQGPPGNYGQSQQGQSGSYGQPPPQGQSGGYGPPSHGPPQGPQLPPGWVQQWDASSQRYYYLEQSTGRSQWDPPASQHQGYGGPPPPQGYGGQPPQHGYGGGPPQQGYGGAPHSGFDQSRAPVHGATTYPNEADKKKKSNKGLIAAGVGGVAVGALGAAALSGDSSDDEHHHASQGYGYGAPASGGYYGAAAAPAGVPLEHNPNLSSSQRSSLEEAREDLEEAQQKVRSGSASSSDIEDLREAQEEYREEREEAHEELYDD